MTVLLGLDPAVSVRDYARSILIDCGGDRNLAFDRLHRLAGEDAALEKSIRGAVSLDTLIRDLLGDAGHGIRMQAARMASGDPGRFSPSQMASLIYLTPLANGTPTRLAKRADWLHHLNHYNSKIRGLRIEAAYARRVLQHVQDESIATQDVLTADALLELRDEAAREIGQ